MAHLPQKNINPPKAPISFPEPPETLTLIKMSVEDGDKWKVFKVVDAPNEVFYTPMYRHRNVIVDPLPGSPIKLGDLLGDNNNVAYQVIEVQPQIGQIGLAWAY